MMQKENEKQDTVPALPFTFQLYVFRWPHQLKVLVRGPQVWCPEGGG